ncbi:MAG: antitoxin component YwqK of YwqJK toxin-antitoxin module [Parvicellaceae bacterium]|jgi:antitoxin component YwqK of YwqJK toxin-antitoxin module
MKYFFGIIFTFSVAFAFAQPKGYSNSIDGLLSANKIITYWDFDSTIVRSVGYVNNKGWNDIGAKQGRWTFYYENGNKEEVANYDRGYLNGRVSRYYENGKVQQDGWFKWDIQDSLYKSFFPDGTPAEKGAFKDGEEIGKWSIWYKPSKQFPKTQKQEEFEIKDSTKFLWNYWKNDGSKMIDNGNGEMLTFHSWGTVKERTTYANGLMTGPYEKFNPAGKPRIVGAHLNGAKEGAWKFYLVDGESLDREAMFKHDTLHGAYKAYFGDGNILRSGTWDMGKKTGHWIWGLNDGKGSKDMEGDFAEDLQHGLWIYYYKNGDVYYKGDYKAGMKNGTWDYFYKGARKWKTGTYTDDIKEGMWTTWFESGEMLQEGGYKAGKEEGPWSSWYENGIDKDQGTYKEGKMNGSWKGWYPNSKMNYEGFYERDMKTSAWKYYFDDGNLRDEGSWKISKKQSQMEKIIVEATRYREQSHKSGLWKSYSQIDGKITAEGPYKLGKKEGVWRHYYPGGVIVAYQNTFKNSQLNGKTTQFSRRGKPLSETSFKNNKKHGNMIIYGRGQKVIYHVVYKNGNMGKVLVEKGGQKTRK